MAEIREMLDGNDVRGVLAELLAEITALEMELQVVNRAQRKAAAL